MVKMIFIIFVVLGFFAAREDGFAQTLYEWVDEKGNVHLSETPPSRIQSKKEEKQTTKENSAKISGSTKKEEEKTTKENPLNILNKMEMGNRTIPIASKKEEKQAAKENSAKISGSTKKEEEKTTKENSLNILNKLEVGNRTIPEDMKKYGPAGPETQRRQEETGSSSSPRRS